MLYIYKSFAHVISSVYVKKQIKDCYVFTEPSLYIDTNTLQDIEDMNLLEIPKKLKLEITEHLSKEYRPTSKLLEGYFKHPLMSIFLANDFGNLEDSLASFKAKENLQQNTATTAIGATILIENSWKNREVLESIDSKIELSELSQVYVEHFYKDVSPFALQLLVKIFLHKNYNLLYQDETEILYKFHDKLTEIDNSKIEHSEQLFQDIFEDKSYINTITSIIKQKHTQKASIYETENNTPYPTKNIYLKLLESLKLFSKLIDMKNRYTREDDHLLIEPVEIKANEFKRFERVIKAAIPSYKKSIDIQTKEKHLYMKNIETSHQTDMIAPKSFVLNQDKLQIALLIDCDNAQAKAVEGVIDELSKYGIVNIRKAYGDWKSPLLKSWEYKLHQHVLIPMQQFAYTKGKNATDIAMVIDTMEILYTKEVKAFAFMTSDSDFTPLVTKLLSHGMTVFGFGERKTPSPFVQACSRFIYTENFFTEETATGTKLIKKPNINQEQALIKLLNTAIEKTSNDTGWSHVAQLGIYLNNNSSFSPLNYGYQKLGQILRDIDDYEIQMNGLAMYVKHNK